MRVFVGHYTGEAGALGGLRPMLEAVVKGLQKVFRKLWWMRISRFDSAPLRVGEFVIAEAHEIHHDPFGSKRDDRGQMRGNSRRRVHCDRKPDSLDINFRNAVAPQESACGVRATHLETQAAFPKARCQTEIIEHRRRVEKFRIKSQTSTLSKNGSATSLPERRTTPHLFLIFRHMLHFNPFDSSRTPGTAPLFSCRYGSSGHVDGMTSCRHS